jgi:hypothetical protein
VTALAPASSAPSEASQGGGPAPKLDELMLAMDVVDTLRHEEGLAAKELGQEDRDLALKARLRQLYQGQGLVVSDRILDDGIRALREQRFTYTPPPPGFRRTLAQLWVRRGRVARILAAVVALGLAGAVWQGWRQHEAQRAAQQTWIELTEALPRELQAAADAALAEAKVEDAQAAARRLLADGQAALAAGNPAGARAAIAQLTDLRARLVQQYVLRIVGRPGEQSGVWRVPALNRNSRNYYLIVEAVAPDGRLLSLPVVNEEDGKTETVTKWGVRVPQSTFDAVLRDKADDGIIQNNRLAEKRRGALEPDPLMPVQTGAITHW